MVLEVEAECPIGKHFGVSGIGEGIVFASKNREFVFLKSANIVNIIFNIFV